MWKTVAKYYDCKSLIIANKRIWREGFEFRTFYEASLSLQIMDPILPALAMNSVAGMENASLGTGNVTVTKIVKMEVMKRIVSTYFYLSSSLGWFKSVSHTVGRGTCGWMDAVSVWKWRKWRIWDAAALAPFLNKMWAEKFNSNIELNPLLSM